jgi:hypothetical protein
MDPDNTLEQLRAATERVLGPDWPHEVSPNLELLVSTMAGDFARLDAWLSSGGFAPLPWQTTYGGRRTRRAE